MNNIIHYKFTMTSCYLYLISKEKRIKEGNKQINKLPRKIRMKTLRFLKVHCI